MKTLFALLTVAALAALTVATPARADIIDDLRAAISSPEAQEDPFLPLHELYKNRARSAQDSGDLVNALEYYRIAATIERTDRDSIRVAREIKAELEAKAKETFQAGLAKLKAGDKDAARALLARSLYLDPDSPDAVPYLKNDFSAQIEQEYTIAQGDTLRRIAEKVYGNPGGELLLTRVNNLSIADTLKPGDTILVPVVGKVLAKRLRRLAAVEPEPAKKQAAGKAEAVQTPAAEPQAQQPVEQDLMESGAQDAAALMSMAKLQFGRGLYATAVSMADEILSKEPNNMAATDIRNESYYALAQKHWSDGATAESMRMLVRLPKDYKDSAALKKKVQAKLDADSEPLYLAGVKYFLAEELEKAVEQWELTLQVNPYHAKARQDLEKARQLLEAVKGI